ncbi:hypothetical protein ACMX2H_14985 [Arthrobacter sulfonylureivorans]|uniref:hypothetical protein n=1 Tax=Arthrobacter sulfonylureivorans TaxID=2486855 RepID=UPI0039E407D0
MSDALPPSADHNPLFGLLASGDRAGTLAYAAAMDDDEKRRQKSLVRKLRLVVSAEPTGARSPDGWWLGPLTAEHWAAADIAHMACIGAERSADLSYTDRKVARDAPPALFPDRLELFVESWSARFERNPKGWDRNRGTEAMFDWVRDGLVPAPAQRGAMLLLLGETQVQRINFLKFLGERPGLINVTLKELFHVPGVKGASAMQFDEANPRENRRLSVLLPQLVKLGYWDGEWVRHSIEHVLASDEWPEYQKRFFKLLRSNLAE